jgi:hypothetical protein
VRKAAGTTTYQRPCEKLGITEGSVRFPEAAATIDTRAAFDIPLIGTNDVLRQIAPAVLRAGFIRVIRTAQLASDVHGLTAQMNAWRFAYGVLVVIILFKCHKFHPFEAR